MMRSSMVTTTSFSTFAWNSMATREAVSKSIVSLTVANTPSAISFLMTSAAVAFRRSASSLTVISSGIVTVIGFALRSIAMRRRRSASVSRRALRGLPRYWLLRCVIFCFCTMFSVRTFLGGQAVVLLVVFIQLHMGGAGIDQAALSALDVGGVRRAGLHRAGRRDGRARLLMRLLAAILLRRGTDRRDLARLHRRTARRIPLLALCTALLRRPRLGRLVAVLLRRRAHRRNLARLYRRTARRIPLLPLRTVLLRRLRLGRLVSALLRLCRARGRGGLLRGGGFAAPL